MDRPANNSAAPLVNQRELNSLPRTIGIACVLVAVLLVVWQGALSGDFQFDDYGNIVENRAVRSLWPLDTFLENGRPLGLYSFALNYHFSQLNVAAFRLTNLSIHIVNVLLLFVGILLTCRLWYRQQPEMHKTGQPADRGNSRPLWLATVVALIWGIHPLTTQAVTNIVQRYELLAVCGYLGAWVGLLLVLSGRHRSGGLLVFSAAWIGLLSKEIFATAPLALLLFDRLVTRDNFRQILRQRWLLYALMLTPLLWFVPSVLRWFDPQRSSSMGFGLKSVSAWEYLRTQPEVILHYLRLTFWPSPLCFDYVWPIQQQAAVYMSTGLVILTLLAVGFWCYGRGLVRQSATTESACSRGLIGWLLLTFFFILAPTSSFMPIADLCVEHRMYLPSAVVVAGLVLCGRRAFDYATAKATNARLVTLGTSLTVAAIVLFLGWRTQLRNLDYRSGVRLWQTVVQIRPQNPRAWYMLGTEHFGRGQFTVALPYLQRAVAFQMPVAEFHAGLADCLRELQQPSAAITEYQRAIDLKPTLAKAHNGLGVIRHQSHDLAAARESFAIATKHGLPEARYNLAAVLIDLHEYREAAVHLETMLTEHPEFSLAARRLAWILATAEEDSLRDGNRALALLAKHFELSQSENPHVWDTQAAALAELGQFEQATEAAERARELARMRNNTTLARAIGRRLAPYRQNRPWRATKENR